MSSEKKWSIRWMISRALEYYRKTDRSSQRIIQAGAMIVLALLIPWRFLGETGGNIQIGLFLVGLCLFLRVLQAGEKKESVKT